MWLTSQRALWGVKTMTRPTMTHPSDHLCEQKMKKKKKSGGVTGSSPVATKHLETSLWDWRAGWLWITQSSPRSLCLDMLSPATVVKHLWRKTSGEREFRWCQVLIGGRPAHGCGNGTFLGKLWNCHVKINQLRKDEFKPVCCKRPRWRTLPQRKGNEPMNKCWQSHLLVIRVCYFNIAIVYYVGEEGEEKEEEISFTIVHESIYWQTGSWCM